MSPQIAGMRWQPSVSAPMNRVEVEGGGGRGLYLRPQGLNRCFSCFISIGVKGSRTATRRTKPASIVPHSRTEVQASKTGSGSWCALPV